MPVFISQAKSLSIYATAYNMDAFATQTAEFLTFTNKNNLMNAIDTLIKGGKAKIKWPDWKGGYKTIEVNSDGLPRFLQTAYDNIFAFRNTPANIVGRMLEYTPAGLSWGLLKGIARYFKEGKLTPQNQRALSLAIGRGGWGLGLMILGFIAAAGGWGVGVVGDDKNRRRTLEAAGIPEGSVKIPGTDRWVQVANVAPLGAVFAMGATIHDLWKKDVADAESKDVDAPGAMKKIGRAGQAISLGTIGQHPLTENVKYLQETIMHPGENFGSYSQTQAGSLIPSGLADVARVFDPKERDVNNPLQAVQKRIPFARNLLPERKDVLGRPIESTLGSRVANMFVRSSSGSRDTSLLKEMRDLDVYPGPALPTKGESKADTRRRGVERDTLRGAVMDALVDSEDYRTANREVQRESLRRVLADSSSYRGLSLDKELLSANAGRLVHNTNVNVEENAAIAALKQNDLYLSLNPHKQKEAEKEVKNIFKEFSVAFDREGDAGSIRGDVEDAKRQLKDDKSSGRINRDIEAMLRELQ